jgi:hypothetical protein
MLLEAAGVRALVIPIVLALGCSYQSVYAPPVDGRARVAWDGWRAVPELRTAAPSQACLDDVERRERDGPPMSDGPWVPPPRRAPVATRLAPPFASRPWPYPLGILVGLFIEAAIFVAAFALPFEDFEAHQPAANSIDVVNAFNDAARTPGSPCAPPAEGAR